MSKILLIEDSLCRSHLLIQRLQSEGYRTLTASDGLTGVRLAQDQQPDLVICDVTMPRLDGYSVLSQLRKNIATAVTSFIFLSAKSTRQDMRRGMELGADDYLTKPCSVNEVLKAVAVQLRKKAALKQWYGRSAQMRPMPTEDASDRSLPAPSIFPENPKLEPIFAYIEANFHRPIALVDVAQATNYSPAYMTHLVKCQTQRSVGCWIVERRMAEARKLLLEATSSVKGIAARIGYSDPGYFTRQFKQHHQMSPTAWQKHHLQNPN